MRARTLSGAFANLPPGLLIVGGIIAVIALVTAGEGLFPAETVDKVGCLRRVGSSINYSLFKSLTPSERH